MKSIYKLLLIALAGVILIIVSYFFVDKPVVWFLVAHHSQQFELLKLFANDITAMITIVIFLFYIYYAIKLHANRISDFDKKFLLGFNAVVIGQFLKNILKPIFARYWPATWVCNNPSLVKNHMYGFNWFKSGSAYASFPSGHTTFIFSFSVSMWFLFPKLRWLWSLLAFLLILGQIGMYYHFVSDVIAGALLGSLVGFYSVYGYRHNQMLS
ncbi:MAG: phosphatase PAP2 family protein [Pseudomonadota bacterium]